MMSALVVVLASESTRRSSRLIEYERVVGEAVGRVSEGSGLKSSILQRGQRRWEVGAESHLLMQSLPKMWAQGSLTGISFADFE